MSLSFETYAIKSKYKGKSKEELQNMQEELQEQLTTAVAGDIKVIEKEISKIQEAILILDDTAAADIAGVERNLFSNCKNTPECTCSKCALLKRKDLHESVIAKSPFQHFFN